MMEPPMRYAVAHFAPKHPATYSGKANDWPEGIYTRNVEQNGAIATSYFIRSNVCGNFERVGWATEWHFRTSGYVPVGQWLPIEGSVKFEEVRPGKTIYFELPK